MSEMETKDFVNKVLGYKTYSDKDKIDKLLHQLAIMWQNTGTDSLKGEIQDVKKKCRIIYRGIKEIDPEFGKMLLNTQDA